ncbi:26s proteasome non-atpase regulatory subunit 6 [Anaeramoeba flamelloides]|uniref:26s proteasome non-atpase regulatory subunit 6 n=1 Tax=Anaeramoeba flamelloides TaxID=1746091 RepID=A0ABQ8XBY0_9EUKA|nr:26s proteasome non-atpase regulatory subunit 6 [Anaeramoeba flamelloides]
MLEEEEQLKLTPRMELIQYKFLMTLDDEIITNKKEIKEKILKIAVEDKMAPYYSSICKKFGWEVDEETLKTLKNSNAEELKKLNESIKNSEENDGESEIRKAYLAKSVFYCRIGEKEKALELFNETFNKTVSIGQKVDLLMTKIRMGFFFDDISLVETNLTSAKVILKKSSDWERKNRIKVYEGYHCLKLRQFKKAANFFLDSIATFTANELFDYTKFVYYSVLSSIVSFPRTDLKKKVIDAPEILTAIEEVPHLSELLNSLYDCQYKNFYNHLIAIYDGMELDKILSEHRLFFCKQMRIIAYSQFLEAYRSVTLKSMAETFGVSITFLDKELSRFISGGKIHAKIDKVGGVVETTRADSRNEGYKEIIKIGDPMLNRIQKLARILN